MAADPVAGGFVQDDVVRLPALERDLVAVLGPDWAARSEAALVPATVAYCDRLREVGAGWPGGWVGHQYVRYLGDLSGGLYLRRAIERVYGIDAATGTAFYDFPKVPDPAAWKDAYRHRLDVAPWGEEERERIIEEILDAYRWNTELLEQLGG
jgi:heme oxygenase